MKIAVMLRGVLLVIVAVASSWAEGDVDLQPGDGLDATGNQSNLTQLSRMSEGKTFMNIRSSIAERGSCEPTESCVRADGHCVKNKRKCSGAVDPRTCIGRKCLCCMPHVVKGCSPSLSCCSAGGHCVKSDADCEGDIDHEGCSGARCKCCLPPVTTTSTTTTSTTTTSSTTTDPDLPWVHVGNDSFVVFLVSLNWTESQELCESYGLNLYHPDNIIAVAEYLDQNNYNDRYWMGAKGNGTNQVWIDGDVLPDSELWISGWYRVATDRCTALYTGHTNVVRGDVLWAQTCSYESSHIKFVCG